MKTAMQRKRRLEKESGKSEDKEVNEDKDAKRSKSTTVAEDAVSLQGESESTAEDPSGPIISHVTSIDTPLSDDQDPLIFTCASCQFQTTEEEEFTKHTLKDHKSDLSMWCKNCDKCFTNAGVLVSHIKERACTREEMIYKCGAKDCSFETSSVLAFFHHPRHSHKGTAFIYCVHCQKMFTLPHCLILHMQNDCPFKEKNKKNPSDPVSKTPDAAPVTPKPTTSFTHKTPTISSVVSTASKVSTPRKATPRPTARGKGRGRGRGRPVTDSSDSEVDDPVELPEENVDLSNLRRSGRLAKK